jgi:hypothetical protein
MTWVNIFDIRNYNSLRAEKTTIENPAIEYKITTTSSPIDRKVK